MSTSIKGKVVSVKDKYLTIYDLKTKSNLKCFNDPSHWYKPGKVRQKVVLKGDTIYAKLKEKINDTHYFAREPLVIVGSDITTIKQTISDALNTPKPNFYYNIVKAEADKFKIGIEQYLDEWSDSKLRKRPFPYSDGTEGSGPKPFDDLQSQSSLGTGDKIVKELSQYWFTRRLLRKFHLLDIQTNDIIRLEDSLHKVYLKALQNPFSVLNIPIERCLIIFEMLYKQPSQEQLICAQIARKLYRALLDLNHNCLPASFFMRAIPQFETYLPTLEQDYGIKLNQEHLYLPYPLKVEQVTSKYIRTCLEHSFEFKMGAVEYTRDDLSPDQKAAIKTALSENVTIITGGAGTGKTTVIREIIHNLQRDRVKFVLSAFTGKAVSRLKEVTSAPRSTKSGDSVQIATLDFNIYNLEQQFEYLLIDETSMVSTELFYRFIKAKPYLARLVFIGDPQQLPPISWGNLFLELFKTKVKVCRLTHNHRSDVVGENGIILNTDLILKYHSRVPAVAGGHQSASPPELQLGTDLVFQQYQNFKMIDGGIDMILRYVKQFKLAFGNVFDPQKPILKIISPYEFPLKRLNQAIGDLFRSPSDKFVKDVAGRIWRENEVAIMTQNKHKLGIMNGDECFIKEIDYWRNQIKVNFANGVKTNFDLRPQTNSITRMVETGQKDVCSVDMLIPAYAITVHKSQGSEWEYVILYMPKSRNENEFLDANLIYTAMTRARKSILCIGDSVAMAKYAQIAVKKRYDLLGTRI